MEFTFKNFGKAGSGAIRINDLTIICGRNNTGKTYLNYAIYSILKNLDSIFRFEIDRSKLESQIDIFQREDSLRIELSQSLGKLVNCKTNPVKIMGSEIHKYFEVLEENFSEAEISLQLEELSIRNKELMYSKKFSPFNTTYVVEDSKCHLDLTIDRAIHDPNFIQNFVNDKPASLEYLESGISDFLFESYLKNVIPVPSAITSERTGTSLFYKSFDARNEDILKSISQTGNESSNSGITDNFSKMALPIRDNIALFRNYESISQSVSYISKEKEKYGSIFESLSKLVDNGSFEYRNNSIYFHPVAGHGIMEPISPLYATSSSLKSIFLFDVFIRNIAQENSILLIDEPELNLFVDKQIEIAHLVARLVNAGVKVLVTTHSDYFVREINNFIMLANCKDRTREIMEDLEIQKDDLLDKSQVSAYETDFDGQIREIVMHDTGIDPEAWNRQIVKANTKSDKIFYLLGD